MMNIQQLQQNIFVVLLCCCNYLSSSFVVSWSTGIQPSQFISHRPIITYQLNNHHNIVPTCRQQQLYNIMNNRRYSTIVQSSNKNENDPIVTTALSTSTFDPEQLVLPFLGILVTIVIGIASSFGYTINDITTGIQTFVLHPQTTISTFIDQLKDMGPIGALYFGLFYLIAETLAVPATPLALSAGYLFGITQGFCIVLLAATTAACIGFYIGKTYLRNYVEEKILQDNPKFAKLDRAIGEKGFKLLILVRLSPIFPFSISNYIYGASSIDFVSYFWGTLLGFTPSTFAYVYTGMVGKDLMFGETNNQPWYIYVAGFGILLTLLKLVTDVATGIIEAIDDDDIENETNTKKP
jgi:uncharacterized membrane protein YdjX (TVP38/TMEM64 family)